MRRQMPGLFEWQKVGDERALGLAEAEASVSQPKGLCGELRPVRLPGGYRALTVWHMPEKHFVPHVSIMTF